MEKWLKRKQPELKVSTFNGYQKIVDGHLIPWFGQMRITEVKKKDIRAKLEGLGSTNKTLGNIQSVFRAALADAVDDDIIEASPLNGWRYKVSVQPKPIDDIDPFSITEQAEILNAEDGQGRNLLQFAFWTGLRPSEYVALDWPDIDFKRGIARITKAQTQHADVPESPKTAAGHREVKLLPAAIDALKKQMEFTQEKGCEVFQNPRTDARWTGDQPIRKTLWTPCLRRAGIRYRKPYQTRHTYASMMLSAGEHPMWVANQMGHADWTMIARVYGRWMPDADPSAGERAAARFGKQT